MSMQDAKDLHADITKLLLLIQNSQEQNATKPQSDAVTNLQIDGGRFR
jgi:hypothetical protein